MMAVRLAHGVAGVVEVVDELGYDFDDTLMADVSARPPYGRTSRSPFAGNH
jgi:hypothetical protein